MFFLLFWLKILFNFVSDLLVCNENQRRNINDVGNPLVVCLRAFRQR